MNKRLIIATIAVIASVVVIDFLFGKSMDWFTANSKGGDTRNVHYICNEFEDSVAIFGSSRANHHYDSSTLTEALGMPVYNCGRDGNGILLAYCYLHNIISKGHTPRVVIYDFFPEFDVFDNNDHQRAVNAISPYFRGEGMKEIIDRYTPGEYPKLLLSTYRFNSRFLQIVSDAVRPQQSVIRGYKPLNGEITTEFTDNPEPDLKVDTLKVEYFKKFVDLCRDNSIDLVFVVSPVFHSVGNTEELHQLHKQLTGRDAYPLFDFRNNDEFTGHKELFADPAHMNHLGAEKFSRMLADSLSARK